MGFIGDALRRIFEPSKEETLMTGYYIDAVCQIIEEKDLDRLVPPDPPKELPYSRLLNALDFFRGTIKIKSEGSRTFLASWGDERKLPTIYRKFERRQSISSDDWFLVHQLYEMLCEGYDFGDISQHNWKNRIIIGVTRV